MKNLKKTFVFSFIILLGFSSFVANAQEQEKPMEKALPIKNSKVVEKLDEVPAELAVCDHNGDGVRNLSDVPLFVQCKDTFDADGNGVHNLSDWPLYQSNSQDDAWCAANFVCDAADNLQTPVPTPVYSTPSGGGGVTFAIRDLESAPSCGLFDVSWRTTKNSDTILDLGTELGVYTQNIDNDTNTKNHTLSIADLLPNITYYYQVRAISSNGREIKVNEKSFTTPPAEQCGEVLGEKIVADPEPKVLGVKEEACTYMIPDEDILGQVEWADGTLIRGCGPEVYVIENQQKRHIQSLEELFNYIGQRIYNVKNSVLELF